MDILLVFLRMATIYCFENLDIWKKAKELNKYTFNFINRENFAKDYKLVNQINGSCGSIMDNIAEGFGRGSKNEFIQFLSYSRGSCNEYKSQLYRSLERNYISKTEFDLCYDMADSISRGNKKMMDYLNSSVYKGEKFKNRL